MQTSTASTRSAAAQSGFSLLEVMIGASLIAIAVLGHTASIFSEQKLSSEERARSTAMMAMEQFMERMRSDDDFAGLFVRLNNLQELSRRSPRAAELWISEMSEGYTASGGLVEGEGGTVTGDGYDTIYASWTYAQTNLVSIEDYEATRTNYTELRDGRRAFGPTAYYDDFVTPAGVRAFHVAVEVPAAPSGGDVATGPVLREDLPQRFGLPADLNGDGVIDDASHNDDYRTVPVIVTFRWTTSNGTAEELRLSTWVWGYR